MHRIGIRQAREAREQLPAGNATARRWRQFSGAAGLVITLSAIAAMTIGLNGCGGGGGGAPPLMNSFRQVNLVASTAAVGGAGATVDANLANAWGISFSPDNPFRISDNHTGKSTLYDGAGVPQPVGAPLVVNIPGPGGTGAGSPTGTVFNGTSDFAITGGPAGFIFATEDGTIATWGPASGQNAGLSSDNSARGDVYKGIALGATAAGNFLYVTDFHNGVVRVFNSTFVEQPVASFPFADSAIPAGFAPFNIQNVGNSLFVTYAKQKPGAHDDEKGPGNGFVNVFDTSGQSLRHFAANGNLNSPWGVALAPAIFGPFGGAVLIGNFGDGRINAFNATSGAPLGQLKDSAGNPITIDGLWALAFGGAKNSSASDLFFTAGPNEEADGLFGKVGFN